MRRISCVKKGTILCGKSPCSQATISTCTYIWFVSCNMQTTFPWA